MLNNITRLLFVLASRWRPTRKDRGLSKGQTSRRSTALSVSLLSPCRRYRKPIALIMISSYLSMPGVLLAQGLSAANTTHAPSFDTAANGVPIVNINAPSAAGVSRNEYNELNVEKKGVIFNNSTKIVSTQLAGYVDGNSHLNGKNANIILNEVLGHNKSDLNGFMEIAGKSAELIIANQNGISCNGCGFINTTRGTLTTGKSVFDSTGKLKGFDVAEGHIDITGDGLNASNMDEVDLLARSVSLNSKLWAKKLAIVTGANHVNYQDNTPSALPSSTKTSKTPTFALDVAAIGGMYANRILLIGTDKGLGVNLQGEVSATQSMVLNTKGDLVNQNKLSAKTLTVSSAQTLTNTGSVLGDAITLQANAINNRTNNASIQATNTLGIQTQGDLNNLDGAKILSQNGQVGVQAANVINQSSIAANRLNIQADTVQNSTKNGALYGIDNLTLNVTGQTQNTDKALLHSDNELTIHSQALTNSADIESVNDALINGQHLVNTGTLHAQKGTLTLHENQVDNQALVVGNGITLTANTLHNSTANGQIFSTDKADLSLTGNVINTDGALIHADKDLTLNAAGDLTNTASTLEAVNAADITSQNLANSGTVLAKNGFLTVNTNEADNQGTIAGHGITLNANALNNRLTAGQIISTDKVDVTIAGDVSNSDGALIHADKDLTLNATGDLTNTASTLEAVNAETINSQNVTNSGTILAQNGALTIQTNKVDNQGTLEGNGIALNANVLNNSTDSGKFFSTDEVNLTIAGNVTNTDGALIHADKDLVLNATGDLTNTSSAIEALNGVDAKSQNLTNSGTVLAQNGALTIKTHKVDTQGTMAGTGIAITATQLNNSTANGKITSTDQATFTISGDVTNMIGALIHADKDLTLNTTGNITNTASTIEAKELVDLSAQNLTNSGTLQAKNDALIIDSAMLTNQGALTGNDIKVTANNLSNMTDKGRIVSKNALLLTTDKDIVNSKGAIIHATTDLTLEGKGNITNANATIEVIGSADLTTHTLTNSGEILAQHGKLTANTTSVDNRGLLTGKGMTLNANQLNNTTKQGQIVSADNADLTIEGSVTNTNGALIHADKDLTLNATGDLINRASTLEAVNATVVKSQNLTNTGSVLAQNGSMMVNTGQVDNQGVLAGNGITIHADQLNNHSENGKIISTGDLALTIAGTVSNLYHSLIHAANNLTLKSQGDLTNTTATIKAAGTNQIHSQNVTNTGALLSQNGDLTINTNTLDNQGTLAGHGITLNVNVLNNSTAAGQIVSTDKADVTIAGDVSNTDGALIHADKDLTLDVTGDLTNTASTIEAINGLDVQSQNLTNSGTVLAQNGALTVQTSNVNNQGALAGNGITINADELNNSTANGKIFSMDKADVTISGAVTNIGGALIHTDQDLTLNAAGELTNTASTIEAAGTNQITSQNMTNSGTLLAKSGALTIQTNKVDNQGTLAGNGIALNANTLNNSTANGQIVSTDKADVTIAGDVSNTDG
ncbi:two-partner secretion domain-containing protein, partial [Marinomonas spartinae]|uniref:two-partner secretion domain-containing protein n=1 Tax=Marinomonas spartinae TaxID=1792290 RepID=UPI000AEB64E5